MADVRYWVWLQMCLGEGARFKEILEDFGSIEALYGADMNELRMSSELTDRLVLSLSKYTLRDTEEIIRTCDENNWCIIPFDDKRYPDKLRAIEAPPAVLYCDGELPDADSLVTVGIVGTRKASGYGTKSAFVIAKGVALCGALVVSGGALGVDTAAHKGALAAGSKTVAVLGSGLGASYLKSNRELRNMISKSGALITEYPPYRQATRNTFPMRNRIISALSDALVVTEAGEKSGSMITVSHALKQGKDVYAVPCSLFDYNFYGTNKLIEDGAEVVTSVKALLKKYSGRYESLDLSKAKSFMELIKKREEANAEEQEQITFDNVRKNRKERLEREEKAMTLTGDEKSIYGVLSEELESIGEIIEKSEIPSARVLAALTLLEMKGLAESAAGKRYRIKQ